ncbi:DgyrCDS10936 [Dimorphilus gyrociliatus]|uniref:DgyrCDS10936 n=1 Tax=Dimorphilus gyrociliatus TaxID=2664684 RepID=A0A7I8W2X7_9ANNE|nr:DgyrCDS10936 [Dimorphilus gyrociliatus]
MNYKANLVTQKLETSLFQDIFTPQLSRLIDIFKKHNYELRIAGGAVRDLLLNMSPHDIDFATTATPDQMKEFLKAEDIRMINLKGEKHGTITCRIDEENFEVTTLRIDVETDGRHAEVQFTTDWQLDALRRDLTINQLFLGFDGTVYDYYNGINDLREKKVRFVGDAGERIREDYLRILRYFRFYGRISEVENNHEAETLMAIKENVSGLSNISGERIWVELKKILDGKYATSLVKVIYDTGVSTHTGFPQNGNLKELDIVYERSKDLKPSPITLYSALLSDEEDAAEAKNRLKMSNEELGLIRFIIKYRTLLPDENRLTWCQDSIYLEVPKKETKPTVERVKELLKYMGDSETLKSFSDWTPPKFPNLGHKLLERGVKSGPTLGKILIQLKEKWKESRYLYGEEELLEYAMKIKDKIK